MSSFRFLPGIVLAQVVAAILTVTSVAYGAAWIPLAGVFALLLSLLLALWFGSIADHVKKDALLDARDGFARERERLIVSAEEQKRTVVEESHRKILKETTRAHARANLKLGAALVCMLLLGVAMVYVQLVTAGLVTFAAAGGALAGYLLRSRQEKLRWKKRSAQSVLEQSADINGNVIVTLASKRKPNGLENASRHD